MTTPPHPQPGTALPYPFGKLTTVGTFTVLENGKEIEVTGFLVTCDRADIEALKHVPIYGKVALVDPALIAENERLENLTATGIHTCGDHCQRPLCVARRENKALVARNEAMMQRASELEEACVNLQHDNQTLRMKMEEAFTANRNQLDIARRLEDRNGLLHQLRSMLREAGFPDKVKMGEDLEGNEDWVPVRVGRLERRKSYEAALAYVNQADDVTHSELRRLFPDGRIIRERVLGIFTKSFTVYRP